MTIHAIVSHSSRNASRMKAGRFRLTRERDAPPSQQLAAQQLSAADVVGSGTTVFMSYFGFEGGFA
jgi:hypothetical protein